MTDDPGARRPSGTAQRMLRWGATGTEAPDSCPSPPRRSMRCAVPDGRRAPGSSVIPLPPRGRGRTCCGRRRVGPTATVPRESRNHAVLPPSGVRLRLVVLGEGGDEREAPPPSRSA
jgi:hypothetical protein